MSEGELLYKHEALTSRIIGVFYEAYNELGQGFLESVYLNSLAHALRQAGLRVETQVCIPVYFRGQLVGEFKADIVVEGQVILELKAARVIDASFESQLLNYLRATPIEIGLLLNFGPKPEIRRMAFDNARKRLSTLTSSHSPPS